MKYLFVIILMLLSSLTIAEPPAGFCQVIVCNKLERFSLDPWAHIRDHYGEQCFETLLGVADAVEDKILDSQSKWYQGSFNPTKKSVTRVKEVIQCTPELKVEDEAVITQPVTSK